MCLALGWGNLWQPPQRSLGESKEEVGIPSHYHPSNSIWESRSFLRAKQPMPAITSHHTSCCPHRYPQGGTKHGYLHVARSLQALSLITQKLRARALQEEWDRGRSTGFSLTSMDSGNHTVESLSQAAVSWLGSPKDMVTQRL